MRITPAITRYVWLEDEIRQEIISLLFAYGPHTAEQLEQKLGCSLTTYLHRLEEQGEIELRDGFYRRERIPQKAKAAGAGAR